MTAASWLFKATSTTTPSLPGTNSPPRSPHPGSASHPYPPTSTSYFPFQSGAVPPTHARRRSMVGFGGSFRPLRRDILLCVTTFFFAWLILGSGHAQQHPQSATPTTTGTYRQSLAGDLDGPDVAVSEADKAVIQKAKYLAGGFSLPGLPKLGKFGWGGSGGDAACDPVGLGPAVPPIRSYTESVTKVSLVLVQYCSPFRVGRRVDILVFNVRPRSCCTTL
jgi:hypothetical protein